MSNRNSHSSSSSLPIWVFLWLGLQLYSVPSVWQARKEPDSSPNTFPGLWSAVEVLEVWSPSTGKNDGSTTLILWRKNSVFWIRHQLDGANHWARPKLWPTNADRRLQAVVQGLDNAEHSSVTVVILFNYYCQNIAKYSKSSAFNVIRHMQWHWQR